MKIVIDKGIPIPKRHRCQVRETLESMQVGDSIGFTEFQQYHYTYNVAREARISVTGRKLESGGWRIWRIWRT